MGVKHKFPKWNYFVYNLWPHCAQYGRLLDLFFAFSAISWAIKISSVEVPQYPVVGTSVSQLVCNYDLDNRVGDGPEDKLYSVKWYKDGNEFYR